MEPSAREFLVNLLETPSPSGYEQPVQQIVRQYVSGVADEILTDVHGNVIACKNPQASLRLMFAGHSDQIGLVVTHINENGFIYVQPIGGWDPQQLVGQRMSIWSAAGPVAAVIARKPIHLLNDQEKKQVVKLEELWLDIGAKDKAEASERIRIGDPVTFELGFRQMHNGLANAPGMDDKTGLWVVMEAFRRASAQTLNCALFAVATVQEEIGLRGAQTSTHRIEPHVGIAVDVTHATDCPTIDQRQQGEVALGKGPVIFRGPNMNPRVVERLISACQAQQIPYQLSASGRATPNDANTMQISRSGVATGLVSIPNRYMHSAVETISLDDIDRAADLLATLASSLASTDDFTP